MPGICLCMIVRDEAEVIERCLASVKELLAYWVICDTGSSDATPELIRSALDGVPGELHERPWVDFGHNRSEALRLARGKADYLLLLDADWTFCAEPGALDGLTADAYLVRKRYPGPSTPELSVRQLLRADREWSYVGAVHEYLSTAAPCSEARLEGVLISDWADGAVGRGKRFARDIAVLEEALRREPDNHRNVFYLAQTYRDTGEIDKAIELYTRRAQLGGWSEEVYCSLYQVGLLRARQGKWDATVTSLLAAWSARPVRIEPLFRLAAAHRQRRAYPAAHLFAQRAVDRPQPDDILYVEPWVYRWGALFEYSISVYYAGDASVALKACDRLLALDDLPDKYREHVLRNRRVCLRAVGGARPGSFMVGDQRVVVSKPRLRPPNPPNPP